jgi:hypothetical protein
MLEAAGGLFHYLPQLATIDCLESALHVGN